MMYTIEELESIVSDGSNAVDITDIVGQLLDALKRIEAAAAIEPPTVDGILINHDYVLGHHAALSKVRNALGL